MTKMRTSETRSKIRKVGDGYIYEIQISENQHEAFKKDYRGILKDLQLSALEFPFEEYINDEIINERYRKLVIPDKDKRDTQIVVDIMRKNPGASRREIFELVEQDTERRIDEEVKRRSEEAR